MYAKNLLSGAGHGRVRTALAGNSSHKAKLECARWGSFTNLEKKTKTKTGNMLESLWIPCSQMHMHRGSSCQWSLHWIQHSSKDNQGNQQVMPQTDAKVSSPIPVLRTHNSPSIRATFNLKRALGVIHLSCTEGKEQKVSDEKHQIHRVHDAIHRKSFELTKH